MDTEKLAEKAKEIMANGKKTFLCPQCKHKEVCSKIEEPETRCNYFLTTGDYKIYANIHSMFQPIFDWLKFHYPSDEVKFIVDRVSAKMYLEHGPAVFSKELTDFCDGHGISISTSNDSKVEETKPE